ncbi:MAG TPA: hypothetical protein PKC70_18135 [Cellvibrionaceae bacterium]|nr:hypothetical protein [Cellvibrionaceae bacterium]
MSMSELKFLGRATISLTLFLFCSCGSFTNKPAYKLAAPPEMDITFTGRGTAFGPMLMSAMGPAGIAVGMAIDVGIGKDIEKFGFADGLKVDELFAESITQVAQNQKFNRGFFSSHYSSNFQLLKIGFIEPPGQNDCIQPTLVINVLKGGWHKTYQYPEDFQADKNMPLPGASLEQLKSPQSPARSLLKQAFTQVIEKCAVDWQAESTKK